MASPVVVRKGANTKVFLAARPVVAVFGGFKGARIENPSTAADQGIATVETLFYDYTMPAVPFETATCFPLQPGQYVLLPPGLDRDVSVCAATAGHLFNVIVWQDQPVYPPDPVPGDFPPTTMSSLQKVIPSYLYQQYADDDDLQAFVASYNSMQQEYVDWFNTGILPIYTLDIIEGTLLDWVAQGIYGMVRPALASGRNADIGPYNTALYNEVMFNETKKVGSNNVTVTTDDLFKRIMTWRLYRGDGKLFNFWWLKRRIIRFLVYPNGGDGPISVTYNVSVTFGTGNQVNIVLPPLPVAPILKQAIDSGAVELPFQFTYSVTISP